MNTKPSPFAQLEWTTEVAADETPKKAPKAATKKDFAEVAADETHAEVAAVDES